MDFFKSVFSDAPDEEEHNNNSDTEDSPEAESPSESPANPSVATVTNAWTFGSGLLKTLATRSESVIQNYRRDLEEFSSGLQKETKIIREAASRAVKDFPAHIESGAAVAQESLETVGLAIDNIGSSVVEIISHGKDSILANDNESDSESETRSRTGDLNLNLNSKPYSRIDALIRAIQCDGKTYCEEAEDLEEYNEWRLGFVFEEKLVEIGDLVEENPVIGEIYSEIVPSKVDRETFWSRYFYKVYRVKKAEEARVRLVKRAIQAKEDEELSWDIDDDNDNGNTISNTENEAEIEDERKKSVTAKEDDVRVSEAKTDEAESSGETSRLKSDDKGGSEAKNDNYSDFSVVSSQRSSQEEHDLEWDEIGDTGSDSESKGTTTQVNPNRANLHKSISVADDDEELTWDIEDDDDDVPSKP